MRVPSLSALRATALRHRWKLFGAVVAWVGWLLFGWFAIPRIVHPRLERAVTVATGHPATLGMLEFDPLRLAESRVVRVDGEVGIAGCCPVPREAPRSRTCSGAGLRPRRRAGS